MFLRKYSVRVKSMKSYKNFKSGEVVGRDGVVLLPFCRKSTMKTRHLVRRCELVEIFSVAADICGTFAKK